MKIGMMDIFTFLLLVTITYFGWTSIHYFFSFLAEADPKISATIIGGMITIFGTLLAVVFTQRSIKKREIDESHRERKIRIYESFVEHTLAMIQGENEHSTIKTPTEQETTDFFIKFHKDVLLWGSPQVIKAVLKFKTISIDNDPEKTTLAVNKLFKEFRKDLGLSNFGLNECEFIKLFIDPNDIDKLIKKKCF